MLPWNSEKGHSLPPDLGKDYVWALGGFQGEPSRMFIIQRGTEREPLWEVGQVTSICGRHEMEAASALLRNEHIMTQ